MVRRRRHRFHTFKIMRKQIETYQNGFKMENPDPESDGNVDPTEPERAVKNRIRSAVEGDGKWIPLAHDIQKPIIEPPLNTIQK